MVDSGLRMLQVACTLQLQFRQVLHWNVPPSCDHCSSIKILEGIGDASAIHSTRLARFNALSEAVGYSSVSFVGSSGTSSAFAVKAARIRAAWNRAQLDIRACRDALRSVER
mmetsp:Transcript_7967/g.19672  ORF Transcript_7967/g.19672 Transcript_7967/m.19672 type:complete len:112 (+) Transcript_7967:481-816(+)